MGVFVDGDDRIDAVVRMTQLDSRAATSASLAAGTAASSGTHLKYVDVRHIRGSTSRRSSSSEQVSSPSGCGAFVIAACTWRPGSLAPRSCVRPPRSSPRPVLAFAAVSVPLGDEVRPAWDPPYPRRGRSGDASSAAMWSAPGAQAPTCAQDIDEAALSTALTLWFWTYDRAKQKTC